MTNSPGQRQSADATIKIALGDFNTAIITMLHEHKQQVKLNIRKMNGKTDVLSREIEVIEKN